MVTPSPWVTSPAATSPAAPAAHVLPNPWLTTEELCRSLAVSRSTLGRWRRRELLRQGQHWVRKNPGGAPL